jgi:hypothetical protein
MIHRLLCWLMRKDLAHARAEGRVFSDLQHAKDLGMEIKIAYLRGLRDGADEAFASIERCVAERMGGGQDLVMPEDIARAKRGMLH